MKKQLLLLILPMLLITALTNAQSRTWDFSDTGVWTSTTGVGTNTTDYLGTGLNIISSGSTVGAIANSAITYSDGFTSTRAMTFATVAGAPAPTNRAVSFSVTGACTVKIWVTTSSSGRTASISDGTTALGSYTSVSPSPYKTVLSASYTGGAGTIYVYCSNTMSIAKIQVIDNAAGPEIDIQGNAVSIVDGDGSPTTADWTDLGSGAVGAGITKTYTIYNTGTTTLNIGAISFSGTNAADFAVTTAPAATVTAGANTTFVVTCTPASAGVKTAAISIVTDDGDENPYNFSLQGTGNSGIEIDIQGNSTSITDGDSGPTTADWTDLGSGAVGAGITKTYTIYNVGTVTLNIGAISFSGSNAGSFAVTSAPSATVAPGGNTTFDVTLTPASAGVKTAAISIVTDDSDENPYNFSLQGTGITLAPEINIKGNGNSINSGDTSAQTSDNTKFGSTNINSGTIVKTFTIENTGIGSLTIGAISFSGTGFADFSVTTAPSATVAAGGSTTFDVTFNPSAVGVITPIISIVNDDTSENPYTFELEGTGTEAEINIQGDATNIPDGDTAPRPQDFTDFGSGIVTRAFTIQNAGPGVLTLGAISFSGTDAADFAVTTAPSATVSSGGSTTFSVTMTPSGVGLREATISIINDDSDENPYNFAIEGTGVEQEINIQGNAETIADGDATPNITDWTNYNSVETTVGTVTRIYTIQNTGNFNLTIGTITIGGAHPADFTVTTAPSATVTSGSSTTFAVTFDPDAVGLRSATISIVNNDSDENPYNFSIQGTGIETFFDSDGDGVYDNLDTDDDNDGILDSVEEANCNISNGSSINYKFLNETFGEGTIRTTINTTYDATTTYCFQDATTSSVCDGGPDSTNLDDGKYTVGNSAQIATWAPTKWYMGDDHTAGDVDGRMAMFNASFTAGTFYTAEITGSLPNIPITYSFWVLNLDRTDHPDIATRIRPDIKVEFRDLSENVLATISTGDIAPTTAGNLAGDWYQFTASLTLGVNAFKVVFINNNPGGGGNDLALDDISIEQPLCDFDTDGVPDLFDLDADNDGIPDVVEAGLGNLSNSNAKIDVAWVDANGNGLHDSAEATSVLPALDSDGDGIPNYIDLDSDNDSVFDIDESGAGNTNAAAGYVNGDGDINGDGMGDGLETEAFRAKDTDGDGDSEYFGDGILDLFDYGTGVSFSDKYGNSDQGTATGNPATTYLADTDGDGIPDYLDVMSNGTTYDIANNILIYDYKTLTNNNGILDDTTDIDKDGIMDSFDTDTTQFGSPRDLHTKLFLDFDGRNDYGQDAAPVLAGSAGTLMAWIDLNAAFSADGFVVGQDSFNIKVLANKKIRITCNGTTLDSPSALTTQRWYHAAAVYDGTNLTLYINGANVATTTATGTIVDATNLTLGRSPSTSTNFFKGKIDEVRVFDTSFTDNQVQRMVYQEIDETSANLKGSYIAGKEIDQDLTTSTGALSFSSMLRYYRMDTYADDIIDDLTTPAVDVAGMKIYNHKVIKVQEAPMPFVTIGDGDLATNITDSSKDIEGTDIDNYNTIINVKHDNTVTSSRTDLGLFVDSGKSLTVNGDSGLTNTWWLKLDGKIDLEGMSQLVQTSTSDLDVTSEGSIERDQQGQTILHNYNYWSSPVSPINNTANNTDYTVDGVMKDGFNAVPRDINWIAGYNGVAGDAGTPVSLARYWLYKFESNDDAYANWIQFLETDNLRVGQGYTLKGSGAASNFTFVGKPNNGTITTNTVTADELLLVGNPYPSAIDSETFINDNINSIDTGADGNLYFWEHASNNNSHVLANYLGGYAVLNLTGGIAPVVPSLIDGVGTSSKIPNQYIPVGQGFFVYGKPVTGGTVEFNNGQRAFKTEIDAESNSLFKTKRPKSKAVVKKDTYKKIRLGYNTNNGYHRQVLLGFMNEKATSGIDYGYDGEIMDNYPNDMFFLNGDKQLVIQGEGYFDVNASYPIGVKSKTGGTVSFVIDALENFDPEQPIFIHDNVTDTYHDIRKDKFEINLPLIPAPTANKRFSLRFTDKKTLGMDQNVIDENAIKISHVQKGSMLEINNELVDTNVEKVTLFNILGQSLSSWDIENQEQQNILIPIKSISSGVYIVKIKTSKGDLSKKIIIK